MNPPETRKSLSGIQAEVRRRSSVMAAGIETKELSLGSGMGYGTRPAPIVEEKKTVPTSSLPIRDTPRKAGKKKPVFSAPAPGSGGTAARRRSTVINMDAAKDKMAKLREGRDRRRAVLTGAHGYLFEIVGFHLGMDKSVVEEFILDTQKQIDLCEKFVAKDGNRVVMFYYQEGEVISAEEAGRSLAAQAKGTKMMKVFVTDGKDVPLLGTCIYFIREKKEIELNTGNAPNVLMGILEVNEKDNILVSFEISLQRIYRPALKAVASWGELDKSPTGKHIIKGFFDNFDAFLMALHGSQLSVSGSVVMPKFEKAASMSKISTAQQCMAAAQEEEVVSQLEDIINSWCKKIEITLTESERVRREADDTGPLAELEHWRGLNAKYNSILEQIRAQDCRMAIQILHISKSPVLQCWREQNNRLTEGANEAKDNLKYLYTLEKFWEPLYRCDPVAMAETLPSLINAIRMIHSISRYYNTSERMTGLFIKITNQMVKACKKYLTEDGYMRVWEQDKQRVVEKIKDCINLNHSYQDAFHRTKKKMIDSPGEKPFDFSEMYIFGKFEAFCRRLEKIFAILMAIETYNVLTTCVIEGIEPISNKFQNIFQQIQRKNYNILDHRLSEFDHDFDDFVRHLNELENILYAFMNANLAKVKTTLQAITLLERFGKLKIEKLEVEERFVSFFLQFGRDLEDIKIHYMKNHENPPITRCLAPFSGKIMWARQLRLRVEEPMDIFVRHSHVMESLTAKKIIYNYNRLCQVLLEFEMLYHMAWLRSLDTVMDALQVPPLVRHPETRELYLNLDPCVFQVIQEAHSMIKMKLEVPNIAKLLLHSQHRLKNHYDELCALLNQDRIIREKVPTLSGTLFSTSLKKIDALLRPGLVSLTWTSINLDSYIATAMAALDELNVFIDRIIDLKTARIDQLLFEISQSLLFDNDGAENWTLSEFIFNIDRYAKIKGREFASSSMKVEEALRELTEVVTKRAHRTLKECSEIGTSEADNTANEDDEGEKDDDDDDISQELVRRTLKEEANLKDKLKEMFISFNNRLMDSLLKSSKNTMDLLKKRLTYQNIIESDGKSYESVALKDKRPIFITDVILSIPDIIIQPSLEDIQQGVIKGSLMMLEVFREIVAWDQRKIMPWVSAMQGRTQDGRSSDRASASGRPSASPRQSTPAVSDRVSVLTNVGAGAQSASAGDTGSDGTKNYYRAIADNKEVSKGTQMLNSVILSLRPYVAKAIATYNDYQFLWMHDKEEIVANFMAADPVMSEFISEIRRFDTLEVDVESIPDHRQVGPLLLNFASLKKSIAVEVQAWRLLICQQLNVRYKGILDEVVQFIDEQSVNLGRPITDLEDVRQAMVALEAIRQKEIEIDMIISPIEEAYHLLSHYNINVSKEETDKVDTLRYRFKNMIHQGQSVLDMLLTVQPKFKSDLLTAVDQLQVNVHAFDENYVKDGPMVEGITPLDASERLNTFQLIFDQLMRNFVTCSAGEQLFGLPVTDYPTLHHYRKELTLLQKLYGLYTAVMQSIDGYYDILWSDIDIEKINAELTEFQNRCKKLPKGMKDWQAYKDLKEKIDNFNDTCPLLEMMTSKSMQDRHWERISKLTGHTFDFDSDTFTLRNIMEAPILKHKDDIEDICISSVKEKDIEAKLKQVIAEWSVQNLSFGSFKTRGELLLKGSDTAEIVSHLEDSLMVLGSLLSNRYNAPFRKSIQEWIYKLATTSDIIEKWMTVQNLWVYLEAVFVGGDIAKQLPAEAKRFSNIDKSWLRIMQKAHEDLNVVVCCVGDDTLGQLLPHLLEQLEVCQKSLTGYLESKRLVFPRFFFVSDPALLEILGQASDCHTIQPHLLSVSENINEVEFHPKEYERILSVISKEGEKIVLEGTMKAVGNVEAWLGELLNAQQRSLHAVIRAASITICDNDFKLLPFLKESIAQVGLLGLQLIWTRDSEEALNGARFDKKIMSSTNQRFLDILNLLISQTTKEMSKNDTIKFETLITIHVHQRDIFDDLVKQHIKSPLDFEWLKQIRFYFREDDDRCVACITDVTFIYMNEFLGCTDRLVITPLTDRCYITLAQSLGMSLGGAPAGPAGTGKTETTKDMGKALGKYVVVFNCSDQMDFRGLGRIFKGLAQSGSWGCFDEFNRIELPVLSVAAQQIYIVLMAKKERKKEFIFMDGDVVSLNPEFGIFLTMNPGYAGRQELPENLKVLFRTVAMMVPDRMIIIRVKLASNGFLENIMLSQKFYVLYKLCEEQLSKQVHYDFGLRNILSVLRTLGSQKRARMGETESTIVMRVLRDMNLSKLVDEDEPLFLSLISDLFPGIILDSATYQDLQNALSKGIAEAKLINHPSWNLKVVQLFETQRVRHGMMTLGPSGAGKTACIHILMKAMTECGSPHREMRMNPKAITAPQMFGRLDVATNDWTDGIFSTLWRRTLKTKKGEFVWLVLDGPVDAIWIENLNSVLDDTKKLTLANGDRIPMAPNCKIVFEVHNIDNASPATVSRNGMVFMSSSALDWRPILQGWLLLRPQQEGETLLGLFDKIYNDLIVFSITSLIKKMVVLQCMEIKQTIDLLEGLLPDPEEKVQLSVSHLQRLFIFSIMWSMGALLELQDRVKLEEFMVKHESRFSYPKLNPNETIFEYFVSTSGHWQHWTEKVPDFNYPSDSIPEFASILVPNVDNTRTNFLIDTIAKQNKAVLLIGEQGTAKTVMIKAFMSKYDSDVQLSKSVNFSSATSPNLFQRIVESYVDKRVGTTYGPPGGKKMTVFIDDINMPVINEWGDQITNEITRQCMEWRGFYSLEKPGEFSTIIDIQFMGAMIHPGGGRNDIPERLKRRFSIFNCTLPANTSIDKIFGCIGSGYFCPERFKTPVVEIIKVIVPLTRVLWQVTKVKMLPTPAKFHYVFNLRDLSRIWEGMLKVAGEECQDEIMVLLLWKHECTRVVADRFINATDKMWFEEQLKKMVKEQISETFSEQMNVDPYFVDILRDAPELTGDEPEDVSIEIPKIYEMIPSFQVLEERLAMFMNQYNIEVRGANMDLVFFKDAMIHLVKILRIIRTARGNALLVGVGGSGKQSLTKLSSYISGYRIYQITLTRAYGVNNLMDDLKLLYRVAGAEGKGITFIFTDNDIKDEGFLEYINNVLSSGEVANLFARDEMDEIQQGLISVMKKEFPKRPPTQENLYSYFLSRARNNLHIVLCFSPVGEKFRNRSLKFAGLISGCTVDWFSRWPRDALIAVSNHFLAKFNIVCTEESKTQLVETMGIIHDSVADNCTSYFQRFRRQTHVTPKSFLSFLDGYKAIYANKHKYISDMANKMDTGLLKLDEASVAVDILAKELVVKEKDLAVANEKADAVLTEVAASTAAAEKVKVEVQLVKDKAQGIVDEIAVDKAVAEEKLEAARPALEEAEAALQTIKAAHIATVRKLAKPPHLIMRIMDCVLLLFQKKLDPVVQDPERACPKPSWAESLKLLGSSNFLSTLLQFPKDTINQETVELLQPYLSMEDFTLEYAKKVCGDVAGLASWTRAMTFFYEINKEVLPLKANLAVQEARLGGATRDLSKAQAQLDEKEAELAEVQKVYDAAMSEKQVLMDDADACKRKMTAASMLINGLAGEKIRWTNQSKEFKSQIEMLIGDVVLLTGFLSYTGPFNQEYRTRLLDSWQKQLKTRRIPCSSDLNLISSLVDNTIISEWNLQGLPNDELSIQNGIIVTKAARFPLLIDPQGQGKAWIRNREKQNELQVTSLNHKYFRNHLEDCLSLGRPMLIENVEQELDPCLDNVLEKNFIKSGTLLKVKVGDKECDYMKGFYLYITTKLPNPAYTPEVSAQTIIIDFTVTIKGLEDQLLGRVILSEKAELESERTTLVEDVMSNKRKMKELEENLLYKLTTIQGSLVEDESLINVLAITKQTAAEVSEKLAVAADTEIKINIAREEFRPVATRGSVLYFLICEMSLVNCMYQISLRQFLQLFDRSLQRSEKSLFTSKRLLNIIDYLTFEIFRYTCRGLYEEHKFLLTLFLTLKKDLQMGHVRHQEFQVLIKGGAALDLNAVQPKPCKWITDMTWLNIVELSRIQGFGDITNQIPRSEKAWKQWFDKEAPEEEQIPDNYNALLDPFHKLLLIRCWCPDRILAQARKYVADSMGARYIEPVILDLKAMYEEGDKRTPLICLLSMGSDPTSAIEDLAKKSGTECRCISMGQGQEIHARNLLSLFMGSGGWALLQNCHLGLAFMDELFDLMSMVEQVHDNFRLWITTEVHPKFSIGLLQISIKFTNEPPMGIKAGLKRTYNNITQDFLEINTQPQWRPMLYGVSFLHTVVQERRKFGPLGWNIPYEFNLADWSASVQFVQNHLDDMDPKKGVSWITVRYMLGEIQYGGRVTDDFDKRLLVTFAKVWFSESMFQDSFQFYVGYQIPGKLKKIEELRSFINMLPNIDSPEAFGLHPNADITYQSNVARNILDTILNIQPKDSSGGGETRESVVYRMSEDMLSKLPPNYVVFEVRERLKKMGILQPLNIFLKQEIDRMRRVLTVVKKTLSDLRLAIEGTIIMNENLRDALDNIYDAKVPNIWRKISWPSSTIGFWFTELLERNDQFSKWLFDARPNVFWMTGFFNAQGFLTAMRQEVTRAHKGWSLDGVMLTNDVTKWLKEDISSPPQEGVYIHGLYLDGASWDRRTSKLSEPHPKVLFSPMPVVHMFAIQTGPRDPRFYQCPVYKKPNRTDLTFVTTVMLRTTTSPDHWVLRGVAALCDIK